MALQDAQRPGGARRRFRRHGHAARGARLIRLSVVTVTFNSAAAVRRSLPALADQLDDGDELIVVDNGSSDGTPAVVAELAPRATVIEAGSNLGFAAGCNEGAARASGDLLVLLNPDAVPAAGFCGAIRAPALEQRGWAAWMGLVTADGGRIVNTEGGVVHFTGLAWAGGAGRPLDAGAAPRSGEVGFASGACLAIPLGTWRDVGGFPGEFFLYHEDVDLSLRLRLGGGHVGIEPTAVVDHEYEFEKGRAKWGYLERNRWALVLRTYPAALLALVAPALLATELALTAAAISGGWGREKLGAATQALRWLPRLLGERRAIQSRRAISAAEFADALTADLSSPYLGAAGRSAFLGRLLRAYWSVVRALLATSRRRSG